MKANFDFIAPFYDRLAHLVFGEKLLIAQKLCLDAVPKKSRILIIGGGSGLILPQIIFQCQPKEVIYLEDSAEMLWQAYEANKAYGSQIRFVLGDECYLQDLQPVDIVLTFFFLDVFKEDQLKIIIKKTADVLRPNGLWLVADFNAQSSSYFDKALVKVMHLFFKVFSKLPSNRLRNFEPYLEDEQLERITRKYHAGQLLISEVWKKQC